MKRSTLAAIFTFVLLVVAFFATRETHVAVGVKKLSLPSIKAESIDSLSVGALELKKSGTSWTVTESGKTFPADSSAQLLANAISEVKSSDFITDSAQRHAELEVDDAKGVTVVAKGGTGSRELIVGKASKSGGAYVRVPGSTEVFSVGGALGNLVHRPLNAFREKRVPLPPLEAVKTVEVRPAGGEAFVLSHSGTAWTLEGSVTPGFLFDGEAASRLVTQLTSVTAQEFTDEPVTPQSSFVLTKTDGSSVTFELGAPRADGAIPSKLSGDTQTFVLPSWVGAQLVKTKDSLRDLRLLRADAATASKVSVTAKGSVASAEKSGETFALTAPKTLPAGFEFDPAQALRLVERFGSVRGLSVVADDAAVKAAFKKPAVELEVVDATGTYRAVIASTGAATGQVYARTQDGLVVTLAEVEKSSLERGVELFKKPALPPQGGGQMTLDQLPPEIRAKIEAQLRAQQPQ